MSTFKKIKTTLKKIGAVSGVECAVAAASVAAAVLLLIDGQPRAAVILYGIACAAMWFAWLRYRDRSQAETALEVIKQAVETTAKPKRRAPAKPKKNAKAKPRKK